MTDQVKAQVRAMYQGQDKPEVQEAVEEAIRFVEHTTESLPVQRGFWTTDESELMSLIAFIRGAEWLLARENDENKKRIEGEYRQ